MTTWLRRPRPRVWPALNAVSTVALVVIGGLIGATHHGARLAFVVLAAVLTVLQLLAQARRRAAGRRDAESAEQLAEDMRTVTNNAMSNAFTPILRLVADLLEAPDEITQATVRGQIVRSVVYAASLAIGPEQGVRACFFALEEPDDGPACLRWTGQHAGRADEPKSNFAAGTLRGDAALAMVFDDDFLFCADIETDPPPGWDGHEHAYRTFLAVPVRGADHVSGMLTVDSLTSGDLDPDRDKPILVVLSRILALSQITPGDANVLGGG